MPIVLGAMGNLRNQCHLGRNGSGCSDSSRYDAANGSNLWRVLWSGRYTSCRRVRRRFEGPIRIEVSKLAERSMRQQPTVWFGLHRRARSRRGGPARWALRNNPLAPVRSARGSIPGSVSRDRSDFRARRQDLYLGRRDRGHRSGACPARRRPWPRGCARGGA